MSTQTWITIVGLVVINLTIGTMIRTSYKNLGEMLGAKLDRIAQKPSNKNDGIAKQLSEFRLETREQLARHDERLAAIERQLPTLLTRDA